MGLPGATVWPLLFLVAVSPELLSPKMILATTETALKASSVTIRAPSTPALTQAGRTSATSAPDKSTLSKASGTPSANGNTSIAPPGSIPTETQTTEAVSRTPGGMTPGLENSTTPEGSDEPPTSPGKEPASHSTVTAQPSSDGDGDESSLSQKPGLVAVICIFVSILLVGTGSVTEGSPFARYPPK
ncbi:hypothetical protein JRQ81_008902 [Phrynocephalus forsythii]|uniref:Uncharacterized protein n=1 Tax=Phrynocephalus forsythii TaxID=171643 RepID=A0A9Q1ASE6_9SAUR|nr:hypothetical protein JRQ81_008902 [Phrynocephalus forsythii]